MIQAVIEQQLLDQLAGDGGGHPLIFLLGPRGSGRSRLLRRVAGRLAPRGILPVVVEMERVGACPRDLARGIVDGVARAAALAGHPPFSEPGEPGRMSLALAAEMARSRPDAAFLLATALSFPRAAAAETGQPVALLLDEIGEVLPMSRHAGLRGLESLLAVQLTAGRDVPVLATVSPASRPWALLRRIEEAAREAGRPCSTVVMPPWSRDEMAWFLRERSGRIPSPEEVDTWLRGTAGRPLYAGILAGRVFAGDRLPLVEALAAEMTAPHGALHLECRFDYHLLVERSRGHAAVRSVLHLIARRGAVNLTTVARHVRTALPTATDYLSWLMEVGLIRREGRSYFMSDPLLGLWVAINGPEACDPLEESARLLASPASPDRPTSSILMRPALEPAPPRGGDFPMEID